MPLPIVALPCGSRSISKVRCPACCSAAARLTQVVVLPTPPFWLATQKILAMVESGYSICKDRAHRAKPGVYFNAAVHQPE
ncbi:hypothetical protein [Thauera humireducens]|uniref:hypothetical protein n=1 Tax=Thauera humireducens TaxID=1134435 RepID=UPI00311D5B54